MNLNLQDWKSFYLKDLYDIQMGNGFDKNKLDEDNPEVNLVSRVSYNNGVDIKVGFVEGIKPFDAGLITVALGGSYLGSCFVQEEQFYTGQNVAVMKPKFDDMTHSVNIFISGLVRFESKTKYYAFGRELNTHIRKDFDIKLPVKYNNDGTVLVDDTYTYSDEGFVPDWQFIDSYMKSLHHKPLTTKNKSLNQTIDATKWEEFNMTRLFEVKRGSITSLNEIDEGKIPIVSASGDNEGISFYGDVLPLYNNKITISMNGVNTGFTAYHGYDFNINVDCCVLLEKFKMNKYIGLFMATIIGLLRCKYSYGRKMSAERIETEVIKLPVKYNTDGTVFFDKNYLYSDKGYVPDWQFMEDYIKSLPYGDKI